MAVEMHFLGGRGCQFHRLSQQYFRISLALSIKNEVIFYSLDTCAQVYL